MTVRTKVLAPAVLALTLAMNVVERIVIAEPHDMLAGIVDDEKVLV